MITIYIYTKYVFLYIGEPIGNIAGAVLERDINLTQSINALPCPVENMRKVSLQHGAGNGLGIMLLLKHQMLPFEELNKQMPEPLATLLQTCHLFS